MVGHGNSRHGRDPLAACRKALQTGQLRSRCRLTTQHRTGPRRPV